MNEGTRRYVSHVRPLGDLIEHLIDNDGDCVCGPRVKPVLVDGVGGIGWIYVHASLDGRELSEGDRRGRG